MFVSLQSVVTHFLDDMEYLIEFEGWCRNHKSLEVISRKLNNGILNHVTG